MESFMIIALMYCQNATGEHDGEDEYHIKKLLEFLSSLEGTLG